MPKAITYPKQNKVQKRNVSFQPPQFVVIGKVIGKHDGLPVVDDSSVRVATEQDAKRVKYRLEAQLDSPPHITKKKKSSFDNFNSALADLKKKKNSNLKLTRDERLQLWKQVKEAIEEGKIRPSKSQQKTFINQLQ